jgi:hypothetical protein
MLSIGTFNRLHRLLIAHLTITAVTGGVPCAGVRLMYLLDPLAENLRSKNSSTLYKKINTRISIQIPCGISTKILSRWL